jgi:hypothetical protein
MQAVATGNIHAIVIDQGAASFSVVIENNEQRAAVDGPFRTSTPMPEGGRIEAVNAAGTAIDTIRFYPTNRVDPARVRLIDKNGFSAMVECLTPAEEYAVVSGERVR